MPDSKITALTALTAADPAVDMFPVVDVSDTTMAASGTTKRISINNILACSPAATLASATISGDLTVRTNKLAVTSAGVGVGTATLFGDLNIQNGSNCRLEVTSQAGGTTIENLNNARNAYLNLTMFADAYIWNRLGSEAMRLNSTGLGVGVVPSAGKGALQLSSGINFPATQVASSDANTLDDYEEGTFTPTVIGTTTAGTGTYSNQTGYYTKVGRLVTITVYINWTAHTGTGNMRFAGLPFISANVATNYNGISIAFLNNIALTAGNVLYGNIEFGTNQITLVQYPTGGGAYSLVPIDTSAEIAFSATYFV